MEKSDFWKRDSSIREAWGNQNPNMVINDTQYSFSTPEKEAEFIEGQFISSDEKTRYAAYRKEWFRRPKEFDPGPQPLSVVIELVSTCNLSCSMCYTITEEFQNSVIGAQRQLPWPIVRSIIDECADLGVPSVLFSWRGESTLYRQRDETGAIITFPDVLAYARAKGILEITSLTHGQLIDGKMAEAIIAAEPSWVSVSLDGKGDVYNQIRRPKKSIPEDNPFETVIANIKRLVTIRDKAKKTRPKIRTNSIYPAIADDPAGYREYLERAGVDLVTVNELLDFRGEDMPDECIKPNWSCQYPFQRITVSSNGVVMPCTGAHNEEEELVLGRYKGSAPKVVRRTNGSEVIMEIPELTLHEAWICEKIKSIREIHRNNKRQEITPGCRNCRHGAVKNGVTWIPEEWNLDTMEWEGGIWRE